MWDYFAVENGTSPLLYLHHQTSDLIVSCGTAPLLSSLSYNCLDPLGFLGCNHVWNMPWARGSCGIETLINDQGYSINKLSTISQTGGPNCVQDPPGHSVVAPATRVAEIVEFVSARISENENAGCNLSTSGKAGMNTENRLLIYPNPSSGIISVSTPFLSENATILFRDPAGRPILKTLLNNKTCNVSELPEGLYIVEVGSEKQTWFGKVLIRKSEN
ncbi:MAG: T9SS type A sorting domain-containing protein [Bacteroidia bacterium]